LSRIQLFIFFVLFSTSLTFIISGEKVDFFISKNLSQIFLFPHRCISSYFHYLQVSQQHIEELEKTVAELQLTNEELKSHLNIAEDSILIPNLKLMKANIIGRDPMNFNGFLYIDKGERDNVYINQPVVIGHRLVGKVKSVSSNMSLVETFEKPGFAISGMDEKTRVYGIVKNNGNLKFNYVKIDDEINIGDTILTSGLSEIFPKGIMLGSVKEIEIADDHLFKEVIIKPFVQINQISYVYLIFTKKDTLPELIEKRPGIPEKLKELKMVIPALRK